MINESIFLNRELEHCPVCNRLCNQKTNNCNVHNSIFNCKYKYIHHMHRWCGNGHHWITDSDSTTVLQMIISVYNV